MALRLGDLLVEQGVLTPEQRDRVLEEQKHCGRPFGVLAERMFGVNADAVERAWAAQYAVLAPRVDPRQERMDRYALTLINRRQAWQFRVLPVRFDGDELVLCTSQEHLPKALRFAGWRLGHACRFLIAESRALGEALMAHYPMAGMTAEAVDTARVA